MKTAIKAFENQFQRLFDFSGKTIEEFDDKILGLKSKIDRAAMKLRDVDQQLKAHTSEKLKSSYLVEELAEKLLHYSDTQDRLLNLTEEHQGILRTIEDR